VTDASFIVVADDKELPPRVHIIIFRDQTEVLMGWNVTCCGNAIDDYQLVSFENTEGGYPLEMCCGRCFETLGSDVQRGRV